MTPADRVWTGPEGPCQKGDQMDPRSSVWSPSDPRGSQGGPGFDPVLETPRHPQKYPYTENQGPRHIRKFRYPLFSGFFKNGKNGHFFTFWKWRNMKNSTKFINFINFTNSSHLWKKMKLIYQKYPFHQIQTSDSIDVANLMVWPPKSPPGPSK